MATVTNVIYSVCYNNKICQYFTFQYDLSGSSTLFILLYRSPKLDNRKLEKPGLVSLDFVMFLDSDVRELNLALTAGNLGSVLPSINGSGTKAQMCVVVCGVFFGTL